MNATVRFVFVVVAAGVVASVAGGCSDPFFSTTASFRADRQTVWDVAMAQAVVWHPELIDDKNRVVRATKTGLDDSERTYELKVRTDLNPFALRPSTRVLIRIAETGKNRKRHWDEEREFLNRVAGILQRSPSLRP